MITLILGGARSGKSRYALSLAKKYEKVAFIATCQALDKEMKERILKHQKVRPKSWKTYEEPMNLVPLLMKVGDAFDCVIIDCLTLLVSNLFLSGLKDVEVLKKVNALFAVIEKEKAKVIIVSNEVGLGIVPANKLSRDFRDIAGKVNQAAVKVADEVFFVISGLPLKLK